MIFTDQLKREVEISGKPARIISLVPSITELLADLNLVNEIAGITKFCIHPQSVYHAKPRVGGTKKVDHEKIQLINPDLIIASKEENTKEDIDKLSAKYPVYVSDVQTIADALNLIKEIGIISHSSAQANEMCNEIEKRFQTIKKLNSVKTLYLIWRNPYMAAGNDTFIHEMMQLNGMNNILSNQSRYPELNIDQIKKLEPELILLSSEPYPFSKKHIDELEEQIPNSKIILVNGEMFSWYGSKLLQVAQYFNLLNAEVKSLMSKTHAN